MNRPNTWLNEKASNVTSQFGEDGILAAALEVVGNNDRWCVEFGAWDGKHFSNTYNLIKNRGWSGVLIEGNADRIGDLRRTYGDNPSAHILQAMVGFEPGDNLDTLLARTPIPKNFDVLSIDIDGNDYHVWAAVQTYRPKLVVIEYNPTIPNEVDFVQERNMAISHGSSLSALQRLGREKGYELVAVTCTNGLFVAREFFPAFGIQDNSAATLRQDSSKISYLFNGYDGTVFIRGFGKLNWHRLAYRESRMQVLPRWLRGYPENYPAWKRRLAVLYRALVQRGIF